MFLARQAATARSGRASARRPLLAVVAICSAVAFVATMRYEAFASPGNSLRGLRASPTGAVGRRAAAVDEAPPVMELKDSTQGKFKDKVASMSKEAKLAKALDIWESLKPDIKDEIDRYQTFRLDKFEAFMRTDSRGVALFEMYKPGSPEYSEFFEEHMGPYVFDLAKSKLGEGLGQAGGVVLVVVLVAAFLAYFGTDIIQFLTAPFTGFAEDFIRLYGF